MRNSYVIANWKMNLPPAGIDAYMRAVSASDGPGTVVVAPPFPYLIEVARAGADRVATAAQNCSDHDKGAFTGDVSPLMIRDCGAKYVIVGHSERRSLFGETDVLIARKLGLAMATGLIPVLCIGEDLRTRDAGKAAIVLADQIRAVSESPLDGEVIIAYEPVWAIGTGRNASGAMVAETLEHIRDALRRFWPARYGDGAPILYGGSVTPENVGDLVANGRIDGFLVGGASLDATKFVAIRSALTGR
jgi:triosephosphate isomerase